MNYLLAWSQGLGRKGSLTRKLVELLDQEQVEALIALKPFRIEGKYKDLVAACLKDETMPPDLNPSSGKLHLNEYQVNILKWQTVSYLNLLETILSAWRHNTADREIIEEQFRGLIAPEKGMTMLENYRKAAGGRNALPAIWEFAQTILERQKSEEKIQADEEQRRKAEEDELARGKQKLGEHRGWWRARRSRASQPTAVRSRRKDEQ